MHQYQKKSHGNSNIRFPIFGHEKNAVMYYVRNVCKKTFIFDTRKYLHESYQTLLVKCHMNEKSHTSRYIRNTQRKPE